MILHRHSLSDYANRLLSAGGAVFTAEEAEQTLGVRHRVFLDAAERLQRQGDGARVSRLRHTVCSPTGEPPCRNCLRIESRCKT